MIHRTELSLISPHISDLNMNNFMMEWKNMFPEGFHSQKILRTRDMKGTAPFFTRTQRPTRYIIIDFGMSSRYHPSDVSPRELCLEGGDKTVPEFLKLEPFHDPYKTDIYYVANLIRTEFIQLRLSPLHLVPLSHSILGTPHPYSHSWLQRRFRIHETTP